MTSPPHHAMPGRIDGIDATTGGEGLVELEVLNIIGECMLTLEVADSMLGRELWKNILDKLPFKPGRQLVLSHNTSKLVLHESLQQQGFPSERAQISATYVPVNLLAASRFAHGCNVEDEEFSLDGITEMKEVSDEMPALLHNLPKSLHTLTFVRGFNQGLRDVRLPAGLHSLTFGLYFNQTLDDVTWPAGLQSLTFGQYFNQSLDNVIWPPGLQSLTFGLHFHQSLDNVTWPAGLQSLTFGEDFNQSLDNVAWPAGLQSLTFGLYFDQRLDNVTWPGSLQSLTFGESFNWSLDWVTWPAGLQNLTFGLVFDQNLDNMTWPAGIQTLTLGEVFNQSLDNVTWPAGLQMLTFGENFNQSLDNVTWPAALQSLTFGENFDQSLDNVTWPAGLQSLTFGQHFNQSLDNVTWPAGLQMLTFGENFNQSLDNVTWPAGLQSLTFGEDFNQSLDNVTWPAGLQSLTFETFSAEDLNVVWPAGLQSLSFLNIQFPEKCPTALESTVGLKDLLRAGWPRSLCKLVFDDLALVCWKKNPMLKPEADVFDHFFRTSKLTWQSGTEAFLFWPVIRGLAIPEPPDIGVPCGFWDFCASPWPSNSSPTTCPWKVSETNRENCSVGQKFSFQHWDEHEARKKLDLAPKVVFDKKQGATSRKIPGVLKQKRENSKNSNSTENCLICTEARRSSKVSDKQMWRAIDGRRRWRRCQFVVFLLLFLLKKIFFKRPDSMMYPPWN